MKQLSGLDAGFLYMETPTTYGHVSSLSVYERPKDKGFKPYEVVRSHLEARLPILDPFRRRLVEVPFQLDHPWWIEDPDFDLDFHVRHIAVPPPGSDLELTDLVARIVARRLDRSRPLWEGYVIEGLEQNRWALLLKMHHATIDGAAGAEMLTMLLSDKKGVEPPDLGAPPASDSVPSPAEMLSRTAMGFAMRPERFARAQMRALNEANNIAKEHGSDLLGASMKALQALPSAIASPRRSTTTDDHRPIAPSGVAPKTPFNHSISPHRRCALGSTSLEDTKAIKRAFGVTVNDVVMTACAGALRTYLQRHDYPTDQPLVAAVPVSIRTGEEEDRWTNRVSSVFAPLPTHLETPGERLAYMNEAMSAAKSNFELTPADSLSDFAQFSPPAVFTEAARLMTSMKIADRVNPPINLVISNVPGPRQALYLGPAKLSHYYPVSTVAEGQGLNITVQSYEDRLDFGLVACRKLVPDVWDLLEMITDELDTLAVLAKEYAAA